MAKTYKLGEGRTIFFDPSQPKNKKVLQNQEVALEITPTVTTAVAYGYLVEVAEGKAEAKPEAKPITEEATTEEAPKTRTRRK